MTTITLSNDPDLQSLYRALCSTGASILRSRRRLNITEQRALVASLKSGDPTDVSIALDSLGISQVDLDGHMRLAEGLASRHALPDDRPQIEVLVRDALSTARWGTSDGEPAPDPLDEVLDELDLPTRTHDTGAPSDEPRADDACVAACQAEGLARGVQAVIEATTGLAACAVLVVGAVACAVNVLVAFVVALLEVDALVERCVEACGSS